MEYDLEQQIAKFTAQVVHVCAFDRVCDFIGFFDRIRCDCLEGLGSVPFAAALGIAQPRHDKQQSVDLFTHADVLARRNERVSLRQRSFIEQQYDNIYYVKSEPFRSCSRLVRSASQALLTSPADHRVHDESVSSESTILKVLKDPSKRINPSSTSFEFERLPERSSHQFTDSTRPIRTTIRRISIIQKILKDPDHRKITYL